jgi:hypothetical protein
MSPHEIASGMRMRYAKQRCGGALLSPHLCLAYLIRMPDAPLLSISHTHAGGALLSEG